MSQADRILDHLAGGGTLTRLDAWHTLGVLEAPARISELRAKGWPILTEMIEVTNRYGETVKVARWRYDRSKPGYEEAYLCHRRLRLLQHMTRSPDATDRQRIRAELEVLDDSLRQLRAIRGVPAQPQGDAA